ncbi:MAG: lipoprotein [Gemmatimonadota bacterium]
MRKPILALLAALTLTACSTGQPGSPRPNAEKVTRVEIDEAGPSDLYTLVQNLRPIWLRERGATSFTDETDVAVYLDGARMGGRESLRVIHSSNVETLEFYGAQRATARFGAGHVNGAILVTTRR